MSNRRAFEEAFGTPQQLLKKLKQLSAAAGPTPKELRGLSRMAEIVMADMEGERNDQIPGYQDIRAAIKFVWRLEALNTKAKRE